MKIRNGFVSNSSSSSFCIMGVETSCEDLVELYYKSLGKDIIKDMKPGCRCDIDRNAMKEQGFSFCPKCKKDLFIEKEYGEDVEEICEALKLDYSYDYNGDLYVGHDLTEGGNVKSLVNELQNVEKKLKNLFGDNADISVYSGVIEG
ncbi:MAG TPA: hypothetical protein VMX17_02180 [Candidatus Glassbacteria bacterium]|nr:hypothetical protein [Candidatus Glassbacteria bacterium]